MPQFFPPIITAQGTNSALNITTGTVVKSVKGRVLKVSVLVAGSAVGGVYDRASTSGVATSNQVFVIPTTVGVYSLDIPLSNGLTVVPGTGQTVAVTYA